MKKDVKLRMVKYRQLFAYLGRRLANGEQCDDTLRLTKEFAKNTAFSLGNLPKSSKTWAASATARCY